MTTNTYNSTFIARKTLSTEKISGLYNQLAWIYDAFTDFEPAHHRRAVALAAIQPDETVLEVACGTGRATLEIAGQIGKKGQFHAVDLTPGMLSRAQRRLAKAKLLDRVELKLADAASLPYPDSSVDVIFNAYMFDLIHTDHISLILSEFARVLRPGGRIVLVNMSKDKDGQTVYEWLYDHRLLGFASGGCRPVQMSAYLEPAGFHGVQRTYSQNHSFFFLNQLTGTEIVLARM